MMTGIFDRLKSLEREHGYLHSMIPAQVLNEANYNRASIKPRENYFALRISETFLKLERTFWKEYSPLTVVFLRFLNDGEIREIPFVISAQSLLGGFTGDTQGWSEFYNICALGPFPYEEGDVELAIALYAVESRDYAGELFALTDKLLSALQVPLASQAWETADLIKGVIEQLSGLDKVSRKLGFYQAFQQDDDSPQRFRDQYLLKVNAEEQQVVQEKLRVQDGRLHSVDQNGKLQRVSAWDYCLARITASNKTTYSKLNFETTWKKVRRLVNEGNQHMSYILCDELLRQISLCPDLTENDRKDLPFLYKAKFEKEKERYDTLHGKGKPAGGSIGYRAATAGASGLEYYALKLRDTTYPEHIHKGLKKLSDEWDKLPDLGDAGNDDDQSDALISRQLDQLRTLVHTAGIAPSVIADALTLY